MQNDRQSMLILGCGYVGERVAVACLQQGMRVVATTRSAERVAALEPLGIEAVVVESPLQLPRSLLAMVDCLLDSIPLVRDGSEMYAPQTQWLPQIASHLTSVRWAGYLSTTGVYGDACGGWVDESTVCRPASARGRERLTAEKAWFDSGLPAEVFRIAGIYGPGRNLLGRLRAGGYKAVQWQPPHFSSRIHVDDIVAALLAAMHSPRSGRIVNLADDMPLPHADYVCELAAMVGAPAPEILTAAEGEAQLSPALLDFFRDNKRVSNRLLHRELLATLNYPDFRAAVPALLAGERS
ncbi:SDR family oxidoreductase [Mariprofundus erugo]|nr:SDR family oxidoreductase [Mariprofundus erugo]